MSTLSQFCGGAIKSIQRGVITTSTYSGTATLSPSVDPSKTIVTLLGTTNSSDTTLTAFARISLTDGSTVTATVGRSGGATQAVSWQIVEYY